MVSGTHLLVAPAVNDHGGFARRCGDALGLVLAGEGANHLEVDRHDLRVLMMIEGYVVAVGAKAGVLPEERPYLIQRRLEFPADVVSSRRGGERPRACGGQASRRLLRRP
jgi:hypothetical protein